MEKLQVTISGMSCGHCVASVRKALQELPDVRVEDVKVGSAAVAYDPSRTAPDTIIEAIEDAGYQAEVASNR